jgi:hypothetical protein
VRPSSLKCLTPVVTTFLNHRLRLIRFPSHCDGVFVTSIKFIQCSKQHRAIRLSKISLSSDHHNVSLSSLSNCILPQVCIVWKRRWVDGMKSYRDAGYGGRESTNARQSTIFAMGINMGSRSFGRIITTSLSYMKTTTCR